MKIGDKVIIKFNPHHLCDEKLIGIVKAIHPGSGFGGCDMIDVEYAYPVNGQTYTMPFGRHNLLESGSAADFLKMAEHYKALASHCEAMAKKLSAKE